MCQLIPDIDKKRQQRMIEFRSMLHAISEIYMAQPDSMVEELHRDWLLAALELLDDQLAIDEVIPFPLTVEALMSLGKREYRSDYGQLAIDMDTILKKCKGLERYEQCSPQLQGRSYHLVINLESFIERLNENQLQAIGEVPKDDLMLLHDIIAKIGYELGV